MRRRYGPIAPPPLLLPEREPAPATNVLAAMEWLPKADEPEEAEGGVRVIIRKYVPDEVRPEAET